MGRQGIGPPRKPGGAWDSALTVEDFAAIRGVGFEPVGLVFGAVVYEEPALEFRCADPRPPGQQDLSKPETVITAVSGENRYPPVSYLVSMMYQVRRQALSRMEAECADLGGHGVVAVELSAREFPAGGREFTAAGTAISAPGLPSRSARHRGKRPFVSDLSGADFAKLINENWVPVGLAFGFSLAVRHDDRQTLGQTNLGAGNTEVAGYTDLVQAARQDARLQLARDIGRIGGEGVVTGPMKLKVHQRPCDRYGTWGGRRDHFAEASIVGTAVVGVTSRLSPLTQRGPALTVMPVGPWRGRESGIRIVLQT